MKNVSDAVQFHTKENVNTIIICFRNSFAFLFFFVTYIILIILAQQGQIGFHLIFIIEDHWHMSSVIYSIGKVNITK